MSAVNLALALAAVLRVAALLAHLLRAFLTVSVLAAMAASSAESRGSSSATTYLVGKSPKGSRQIQNPTFARLAWRRLFPLTPWIPALQPAPTRRCWQEASCAWRSGMAARRNAVALGSTGGSGHDHHGLAWRLGRLRPVAMEAALEWEVAHLALDHSRQGAQPAWGQQVPQRLSDRLPGRPGQPPRGKTRPGWSPAAVRCAGCE